MAQGILNTPREVTHQRIAAALEAIEQNMSDEHEAVNIDYNNTYSGLSADNVQEAIDELVNEKANTADLGTASAKNFTTSVTQGSNDLVTSGAVFNEFANLPKPEIFKGTLGVNGTITSLPTASSSNEGWEYKVITDGTYAGQSAKNGDTFISDGTQWVYIPSGDETDTDTWRGINVNGSQLLGNGISSGNVNFKGGTNAQVSGSGNDITVDIDTTFSDASSRTNIASGDSIKTILGKIKKWFSDLKTVAFSGSYNDLDNKPTIPSVGDGTLKIQKNGTNVATFTANQSGNATANIQCVDTVDSVMSDSSTNPLQNKVITKELEGAKTTTGNPITLTDAAPVNAVNLSMDLEPIQDLHGYDYPWVGGAGKNLLKMTLTNLKSFNTTGTWNENTYTYNGIAYTPVLDSDGNVTGIKANGTSSDTSTFVLDSELSASENCILSGGKSIDTAIQTRFTTQPFDWNPDNGSGTTLDMTRPRFIFIYISSNFTLNNEIFKPMVRLQSVTDASFAPYTNKASISGRSEVPIQGVGKNWVEDRLIGANIGSNGQIGSDSTYDLAIAKIKSGVTYTITTNDSVGFVGGYFTSKPTPQAISYNGQRIVSANKTFTSPIDGYVAFRTLTGYATPQLELGTTATTYEPYKGKTYTIQLGETVYGGQLDVTRGKMVVDRGYVDLGDLNWGYNAQYSLFYSSLSDGQKTGTGYGVSSALCSAYNVSTAAHRDINNGDISVGNNVISSATCGVVIKDSRYTDATAFKTAVTGQQLVYELATPFTIDLTPTQVKMLENTNTISTDYEGDTITIEYQPDNAIGEAVRVVEESYDPEFAVRPVLKKKAFSGTTDSDGAVTLINASDIPSNHRIIPLHITDMTINGSAGTYFVEYKPYNSGDSVKGYCYTYYNGSQITPVGTVVTGNFYYYDLDG